MSSVQISGNASGTGVLTIASPNTNSSYTATLPAATGTLYIPGSTTTIQSGVSITLTNQTAPDFTSIPPWVKRITLMFQNVSASSTGVPLIQLGTGSTTYTTSGYVCTSTRLQDSAAVSVSTSTSGFTINSILAGNTLSGSLVITNLTSNVWTVQGALSNTTTTNYVFVTAGHVSLGAALTAVRLYIDGTQFFDGGSINILYE
jgi:hypothetical protein